MDYLFSEGDMISLIEAMKAKAAHDVDGQDGEYVLNASETDLVDHFVSKYELDVPELHQDGIYVESQGEAQIDLSGYQFRDFRAGTSPFGKGTRVTIAVPFSGNPELFRYRPNQYSPSPPQGAVRDGELHLTYESMEQSPEQLKARYQGDVSKIEEWLGWMRAQVKPYNDELEKLVRTALDRRREKVLRDKNMVEGLGLPIKQRPGESKTYKVPNIKRKAKVVRPKPPATREPYKPEPALDAQVFEDILGIVKNMAHVIERSPSAFEEMGEEDLRQHFLVQLNGQYEGDASGETFNYDGKTDILIRTEDRNVFIAECKFWSGPKTIADTIDQILGYLSWRDTKAAIILFVRNKNFSDVLAQVVALVEDHPNHKKTLGNEDETDFRFVFGQRDDPNREIHLAVLLFPVPKS